MEKWWTSYPWRMIQTNLREIDMSDIDAKEYVKELKDFNATITMINFGGIIASYDTELEFHYKSQYLTGDSLEDIIKECHKNGIKVIARNDFSKVRKQIYEQNPKWAYKDKNGKIVDYAGDVHVCLNGEYQQIYALKILEEIITKFDIDGLFLNMDGYQFGDYEGNYHGLCYCDNCRRKFKEMYGLELPQTEDMEDEVYQKYLMFQKRTAKEYNKKVYDFVKSLNEDIALAAFDFYRQESGTQFGKPMPYYQHSASSNTRWVKTGLPQMRSSNTSVDFIGFAYRQIAVSQANQELRLWQNIANNGGLDYYIIGRLDDHKDKSAYEGVKRVFEYHMKNQEDYVNLESKANILLVHEKGWGGASEDRGLVRILTEKHYMFDQVLRKDFKNANLDKYQLLILSDVKYLSDEMAMNIDSYVENGGRIIATMQTATHNEEYSIRDSLALKCLGAKGQFVYRDDMRSSMLLIENQELYPTFRKWETSLVCIGDEYLFVDYDIKVKKHLKLIPPHYFGPPERCYYDFVSSIAGVYENNYGMGKAIHIPWSPGKVFHNEGHENTIAFIDDVLKNIVKVKPIKTNLPPMVEITYSQSDNGFDIIQLVNGTGHYGNSFYKPVDLHNISIELDNIKKVKRCVSLKNGNEIPHTNTDNVLTLEIEKLKFFDAIKIIKE